MTSTNAARADGRVGYVSRTANAHDAAWLRTLGDAGYTVTALRPGDDLRRAARGLDVFVAGPLTDAAAAAVAVGTVPTLGLCWAFDLLIEAQQPALAERLRATLPQLAWLHVDSHVLARRAAEFGARVERISVAPWGIDLDLFAPGDAPAAAESMPDDAVIVFSARSWEPVYDVPTVVRGFARARRRNPRLRLVLGGDGTDRAAVAAEIARSGCAEDIVLIGRVRPVTVRDWLRRAAVYVSAAHSDGSSLSMLEALAVGVPVVVTDLDTNREWVDAPEVGAVFPVGNAQALADALLDAIATDTAERRHARRAVAEARGDARVTRAVLTDAVGRVLGELS